MRVPVGVGVRLRALLFLGAKVAALALLFCFLLDEIAEVRRDGPGLTRGVARAEMLCLRELEETRRSIRSALDDASLQFGEARRFIEVSTQVLEGERLELARLLDDRAVALESTLHDRLEDERVFLEDARSRVEAAVREKLDLAMEQDLARMKRKMIYPTVQLRGGGTVGSGVIVYSEREGDSSPALTLVLTAHHVVMEVMGGRTESGLVEEVRVLADPYSFDPEVLQAQLILSDRERDTALLRLQSGRRFSNVADLATPDTLRKLDVFSRAYAVGCPLGNRPLPTVGEISSKNKVVGDQVFWMLNAPTFFGNSGGGVYLASTCQLIGISSMIYTYGKESPTVVPHMGLFVSMDTISEWLAAEGFSFLLRREPVPREVLPRLRLAEADAGPRPAAGTHAGEPSPRPGALPRD